jgi:TolB-like protein/Flp pilus assembly protein TadD
MAQHLGARYPEVLHKHHRIIRSHLKLNKGREVDNSGDGFFLVFTDPVKALKAAVDMQKDLTKQLWPKDGKVQVRMALHWGKATFDHGQYTGVEVHKASRICDAGHGGQIIVSESMKEMIAEHLPSNISLHEIGTFMLKDFDEPAELFQLNISGLRQQFHSPRTLALSPTVAVLPFSNLSGETEQDYFCEGIAEEILIALGRMPGLKVVSHASSFALNVKHLDAQKLGERLNATAILQGSVREINGRLRINVELADATTGTDLWTERFHRKRQDVFAIQDEIAQCVAQALDIQPQSGNIRAIQTIQTKDVEAYEYYLRGRRFYFQFSLQSVGFAMQMFEKAIQLDNNYALAFSGLSLCYSYLYMHSVKSDENLKNADQASSQAIDLDPHLAEAYSARGVALFSHKNYSEAESTFEKALELDPLLFQTHYEYARMAFAEGRMEKAAQLFETAYRLRPDDYQSPMLVAQCYDTLGLPEKSILTKKRGIAIAEKVLDLNPGNTRALYMGANGLVALGQIEKGLQWLHRALSLEPNDSMLLYNAGCIYAVCDMPEQALNCLEKSVEMGLKLKEWFVNDSNLDSIRKHPRFQQLLMQL